MLAAGVLGAVAALAVAFVVGAVWREAGVLPLLLWGVFCAAANAVPMPASRNLYLSMSSPVNVAIAATFVPSAAAVVVLVSSLSQWELSRSTTLLHAAFNRAQLALATAAGAVILHQSPDLVPPPWLAVTAVAAYHAVNWLLVSSAERLVRGTPVATSVGRLLPHNPTAASMYLALGFMGIALAAVFDRVGAWAVALLLLPLIGARQAVRAAREIEEAERDRREMADRLSMEREHERVRIASRIHDVVLQKLAALQLHADAVVAAIVTDDRRTATTSARAIRVGAGESIADLRDAISNLTRGSPADELRPALTRLAADFLVESGVDVHVHHPAEAVGGVPPAAAGLLYDACREALSNVARHAGARSVDVVIDLTDDAVQLTVRDDGVGYRPGESGGLGLELLASRLALAGGSLTVDGDGEGTTLVATTPRNLLAGDPLAGDPPVDEPTADEP